MQSTREADEATLALDDLRRLVQGVRVSSHVAERELGVTGAQLFVLHELAAEPGISIRQLSERTLTDPSSVSVVVARLVERGLLTRRRAEDDARRSVLTVSSRGRSLLSRAPEPYQARLIAALRKLPISRLRQFRLVLSELVAALASTSGAAPLFFEEAPRKSARNRRAKR